MKNYKRNLLLVFTVPMLLFFHSCSEDDLIISDEALIKETLLIENLENQPELAYPFEKGELISSNPTDLNSIQFEKIRNEYILSGDIILTKKQVKSLSEGFNNNSLSETNRTGLASLTMRWANCTVFYSINAALPNQARVTDAIAHWESEYAINFVLRTTETNYIEFVQSTGCSSFLGMIGGRQEIRLANGCSMGNTIHEIGHALGFLHEQQRADRNNSIIVNYQNITAGRESNFDTYVQSGINGYEIGNFDFGSIMLYGSYAFSSNSLPTITRLDGTTFIGQRNNLSVGDLEMIEDMYDCIISNISITGAEFACRFDNLTFSTNGATLSATWSVSSNIQISSSTSNSVSITIPADSRTSGWVKATFSNGSSVTKNIWVGKPGSPASISGPSSVVPGALVNYTSGISDGATTYQWWLPYPYNVSNPIDYFSQDWEMTPTDHRYLTAMTGYGGNDGNVQVMGVNTCGTGGAKIIYVTNSSGSSGGGGTKGGGGNIP